MGNIRKHRDIKLVTAEKEGTKLLSDLVSEFNVRAKLSQQKAFH